MLSEYVCLAVNQENEWTYWDDFSHRDGPNKTQMYIIRYFTQFQNSVRYSDVISQFAERFYLSNPIFREVQK